MYSTEYALYSTIFLLYFCDLVMYCTEYALYSTVFLWFSDVFLRRCPVLYCIPVMLHTYFIWGYRISVYLTLAKHRSLSSASLWEQCWCRSAHACCGCQGLILPSPQSSLWLDLGSFWLPLSALLDTPFNQVVFVGLGLDGLTDVVIYSTEYALYSNPNPNHTTVTAPLPVCSAKLSKYYGGGPRWNPWCSSFSVPKTP